jgi:hypothetical protein
MMEGNTSKTFAVEKQAKIDLDEYSQKVFEDFKEKQGLIEGVDMKASTLESLLTLVQNKIKN